MIQKSQGALIGRPMNECNECSNGGWWGKLSSQSRSNDDFKMREDMKSSKWQWQPNQLQPWHIPDSKSPTRQRHSFYHIHSYWMSEGVSSARGPRIWWLGAWLPLRLGPWPERLCRRGRLLGWRWWRASLWCDVTWDWDWIWISVRWLYWKYDSCGGSIIIRVGRWYRSQRNERARWKQRVSIKQLMKHRWKMNGSNWLEEEFFYCTLRSSPPFWFSSHPIRFPSLCFYIQTFKPSIGIRYTPPFVFFLLTLIESKLTE